MVEIIVSEYFLAVVVGVLSFFQVQSSFPVYAVAIVRESLRLAQWLQGLAEVESLLFSNDALYSK